jgi:hypothetical protein
MLYITVTTKNNYQVKNNFFIDSCILVFVKSDFPRYISRNHIGGVMII